MIINKCLIVDVQHDEMAFSMFCERNMYVISVNAVLLTRNTTGEGIFTHSARLIIRNCHVIRFIDAFRTSIFPNGEFHHRRFRRCDVMVTGKRSRQLSKSMKRGRSIVSSGESSAINYRLDDEGLILKEQGEDLRFTRIWRTEQPVCLSAQPKAPSEGNGAKKLTGKRKL